MSVHTANVLRALVIGEIFLGVGWLAGRVWLHRKHPSRYLNLMAVSLVIYSTFAALELALDRWGKPLGWQAILIFIAATVSLYAIVREGLHPKKGEQDG